MPFDYVPEPAFPMVASALNLPCAEPNLSAPALPLHDAAEHPPHLGLRFLDPRLQRGKIRGVAGARHNAQEVLAGGLGIELLADAEPQDLRQVVIEPSGCAQHFGLRLRQNGKPRGIVDHLERVDVENIRLLAGMDELEILRDEIDVDHAASSVFEVPGIALALL